jgi:hypothetical protein
MEVKRESINVIMECVICMQTTEEIYKVNCGSRVDHTICFGCEGEWRSKMPLQDGMRTMTCPTCRQPEHERTVDSLTRELKRMNQQDPIAVCVDRIVHHFTTIYGVNMANAYRSTLTMMASTSDPIFVRTVSDPVSDPVQRSMQPSTVRRPSIVPCASGRDCRTRSAVNTRTKTHMKCRRCNLVACCRNCKTCITC